MGYANEYAKRNVLSAGRHLFNGWFAKDIVPLQPVLFFRVGQRMFCRDII